MYWFFFLKVLLLDIIYQKKYFFIENLKTLRNGFSLGTYVDLKKMQNCTRPSHNFKVSVDQSYGLLIFVCVCKRMYFEVL